MKTTLQDMFSTYSSMAPDLNDLQLEANDGSIDQDGPWKTLNNTFQHKKERDWKVSLWMIYYTKYHVLSRMASDVFAAPASTGSSESAFSTAGRIISDYRSLHHWLRAGEFSINCPKLHIVSLRLEDIFQLIVHSCILLVWVFLFQR